jgi:GntR family transcriptional regulator/MocR family aminotransferase
VIYAGSASKTLAPGLRLGWISSPTALGEALRTVKQHLDRGTSILEQLTFAELIATGAFDQHVRRMRASYRRRLDDLRNALAASRPDLHLAGISAGLHVLIYLPERGPSEQQIQTRAAKLSIGLHTLASYWHSPPEAGAKAIIIGYATPASHAYHPALSALTHLLAMN